MTENPYTAPQASPELAPAPGLLPPTELASRWARLGASIIDGIIAGIIIFPVVILISALSVVPGLQDTGDWATNLQLSASSLISQAINAVIGLVVYIAINGYFLVKSGQSIGKKALSIQIVDYETNQLLPLGRVIGMRYALVHALNNVPFVGSFFGLVNVLFIFGNEKRCLHDLIANSKVIKKV